MLNYTSQPVIPLFNTATLTAAYTGNRKVFETGGFSKLSLDVVYNMDAGETLNLLEFQLEASNNGTDWFILAIDTTTTTESTITERHWEMSEGSQNILIDIAYKYMRLSLLESGVVTTFGTASVTATLSGL